MSEPTNEPLTPAGTVRREAMLADLVRGMHRTHRARRARRRTLMALCFVLGAGLVVRFAFRSADPFDRGRAIVEQQAPVTKDLNTVPRSDFSVDGAPDPLHSATESRVVVIVVPGPTSEFRIASLVHTDPSTVDRLAARPESLIERIDDDTLLTLLARIRRPAGLIRIGDQVALTAPVTDEELNPTKQTLP